MSDVYEELKAKIDQEMAVRHPDKKDDEVKILDVKEDVIDSKDPILEEALKMGYDPDYDGPNKKTPEQFVKDDSFFKKIKAQNKQIEELREVVKQSLDHTTKVEKAAYQKALLELQQAKLTAVSEGDTKRYQIIDEQEKIVHREMNEIKPPVIKEEYSQDLLDFQERNKDWFNSSNDENKEMVEAADFIDKRITRDLNASGKRLSQSEHLKLVEDKIKQLYRHRFENVNQKKPIVVAKSTVSEGVDKTLSTRLSPQQKEFVKKARQYGSKLTEEAYAKQLNLVGDLRDE